MEPVSITLDNWTYEIPVKSNSFSVFVSVWAGSWNISSAVAVQHVSQISFAQTALSLDVLAIGPALPFACIVEHGCALVVAWIVYVVHITMVVVVQVVIWRKKDASESKKVFSPTCNFFVDNMDGARIAHPHSVLCLGWERKD